MNSWPIKFVSMNFYAVSSYFGLGSKYSHHPVLKDTKSMFFLQLSRGSFESKHNYLVLLSLFKLTTCFGPCTGPSSGHKICIVSSIIYLVP